MDAREKIEMLGRAAQYDLCGEACGTEAHRVRDELDRWIYPAAMPDGRRISMFKVLLTNACENDCRYCAQRAGRDCRRISFQPEELARLFDLLRAQRRVEGIFLSSSVCGSADRTMERMIAAIELIRRKYAFTGYVHLKILPGAQKAAIERAVELADRVSLNLEAPSPERLALLSGVKDFQSDLLQRLRWARECIAAQPAAGRYSGQVGGGRAGITTQFVVGAAQESDREILGASDQLYHEIALSRAYFSAFQPVPDTPLEDQAATPPLREHRLYQSDWLLRKYGFQFSELIFDTEGNLPMEADPKMIWARAHADRFPMEVNRASREELLRIPGVGPISAARILRLRRESRLRSIEDLKKAGVVVSRATPYVLLAGRALPAQLTLW